MSAHSAFRLSFYTSTAIYNSQYIQFTYSSQNAAIAAYFAYHVLVF